MAAVGRWRSVIAQNVNVDVTDFDGLLSSLDTKLQTALETLDDVAVGGAASVTTTNFNGILSASEDTVQKCFDAIDDFTDVKTDLNAPNGKLTAGTQGGALIGSLWLYGSTFVSGAGGQIVLFNAATYYDTEPGYYIQPVDGNLEIGPSADSDSLKFVQSTGVWTFTGTGGVAVTGGNLTIDGITISADSIANDAALTVAAANSEALVLKGGPVQIYDTDWSTYAEMYGSSGDFIIRNAYTTGAVDIKGYKAGPTQVTMIAASPGSFVTLYYDTTIAFRTQAAGITLMTNPATILDQNGETWVSMAVNGAVSIYYDNSRKLETTATGIIVSDGTSNFTHSYSGTGMLMHNSASNGNIVFTTVTTGGEGGTIQLIGCQGTDGSVALSYGGTQKLITTATGITIQGGNLTHSGNFDLISTGGTDILVGTSENAITCSQNGAVTLYYDNAAKLATSTTGVTVTGNMTVGNIVATGSFQVFVNTSEAAIVATANGAVTLYYDDAAKLATSATGVTVSGTLIVNGDYIYGSDALGLVSYASGFIVYVNSNETAITATANGGVKLYYDNTVALETISTGVYITDPSANKMGITLSGTAGYLTNYNAGGSLYLRVTETGGEGSSYVAFVADHDTGTSLKVGNDVNAVVCTKAGAVDLYNNGTLEMSTQTNGIALPNGALTTSTGTPIDLTVDCGTEKTIVLSQQVYDDLRITGASFDYAGVADPTLVNWQPTGAGLIFKAWEFQLNDIAYFVVQLPHTYKEGTDLYAHVHWTPGSRGSDENGSAVGWKLNYSWVNIDGAFGAGATVSMSDTVPSATDDLHLKSTPVQIVGTSKSISSMLVCSITRTDTGSDDTWVTNTTGNLPLLLEVDFHFAIDTMGSRTATAK